MSDHIVTVKMLRKAIAALPPPPPKPDKPLRAGPSPSNLSDEEVLRRARSAANGPKFAALYDGGNVDEYDGDHSAADLALLSILAFWCGPNSSEQIERLFSASALGRREKWQSRSDYRERSIKAALAGKTDFYQPEPELDPEPELEADVEPEPPTRFAEIALSHRFIHEYGLDLRYVAETDSWRIFAEVDGRWQRDRTMRVYTLAKRTLIRAAHEARAMAKRTTDEKAQASFRSLASTLPSASKTNAVVTLTRSHPAIAMTEDEFDCDVWLLNTPAGVVDLKTGDTRPATREDYFTKTTVVGPQKIATPFFDQFLLDIMGWHLPSEVCPCAACTQKKPRKAHEEEIHRLADYLSRLYGYALSGDTSDDVLALEIGDGGNGKNVLNDLIAKDILGEYAVDIPIEALQDKRGQQTHPTELMGLKGARLALARETDEGARWAEARVKRLSGGDDITARAMRQDFITFRSTHKLIVFGNSRPKIVGADQAAWRRRLHLIFFPQIFSRENPDLAKHERKADLVLDAKLRAEAPGILWKLIEGCLDYRKRGFAPPETIREASNEYLLTQNTVKQWLDERTEKAAESESVKVNDLWFSFKLWAEVRREYVGARREFNDKLAKLGLHVVHTETVHSVVKGRRLKEEKF